MLGKNLIKAAAVKAQPLYIEDTFQTWLYTGNGSTQTITNGIDLAGEGGLVWLKSRSSFSATEFRQFDHFLTNTTGSSRNFLSSNKTDASAGFLAVSSFNSNGFSLDNQSDGASFGGRGNLPGATYASWTFRKAEKFFDIVTYTGTGANRTVAHNLGSVPGCIIVKRTDTTGDWQVYHRSLANTEYMVLNSIAAKATGTTRWNSTTPTSAVFSLGTDATVNASGGTYVAYLFAHDAGGFGDDGTESVIKCGSYTEPTNGTYIDVDLGWEPQWILWKRTNNTGEWYVFDTQRGFTASGQGLGLFPNAITTERDYFGGIPYLAPNSTGFTVRGGYFGQGSSMVYIAIRRGPMKTPTSGAKVFDIDLLTGAGSVVTNFPVDLSINTARSGNNRWWLPRLTSSSGLKSNSADAESGTADYFNWDSNTSIIVGNWWGSSAAIYYSFRRAPGFFDVVAYTGTGVARTVPHNLGVAPELMIVKRRDSYDSWHTYDASTGATKFMRLELADAPAVFSNIWQNTAPGPTTFSVGVDSGVNGSGGTYVAYLFATCPGVSKVGSYTGTGTTLQVDCGFASGARFVLIKRTDNTGDWYVWDTARGIVSGNDPYLLLNSTAAEVTSTDYIDPYSAGFEISSTAPAAINASGGSFIFLAIA